MRPKEIAVWQALSAVPAVRTGRIELIADPVSAAPGPRIAEGAELRASAPSRNVSMKIRLVSSGKDSAWFPHTIRGGGIGVPEPLLVTINETADRVAMHAARTEVVRAQAEAAGLPLIAVPDPSPCPNEIYEERMAAACQSAVTDGFSRRVRRSVSRTSGATAKSGLQGAG
jgi:hypothetical protein